MNNIIIIKLNIFKHKIIWFLQKNLDVILFLAVILNLI